jgi:hypothetical protein
MFIDMDLVKVVPFDRSLLKGEARKCLESMVELFKDSAPPRLCAVLEF